MKKRLLSGLLTLCMVLAMLPAQVFAEEELQVQEVIQETVIPDQDLLPDNDELFAGYAWKAFYPEAFDDSATYGTIGADKLTGLNLAFYNALKTKLQAVAAGTETSTTFAFTATEISSISSLTWTKAQLGITGDLLQDTGDKDENHKPIYALTEAAKTAIATKFEEAVNTSLILDYLMVDCPYELYWFDKTTTGGMYTGYSMSATDTQASIPKVTFTFKVAQAYQATSYNANAPATDGTKTSATSTAVTNARDIVTTNASKDDQAKLTAYKEEICKLVSYNTSAAGDNSTPYGDPWQLIHVFDHKSTDSEKQVVCEGYSKAFQYLCDLSTFTSGTKCYTVTGTMSGGTGEGGGHMWNVVNLNSRNLMADITNSDTGSAGVSGELFLTAVAPTDPTGKTHVFTASDKAITYIYDESVEEMYGSYLKLNPPPKAVTPDMIGSIAAVTYTGSALTPSVTVTDSGKTLVENTDYTISYSSNINAGTAMVTITGKGNYTGTASKNFTINKANYTGTTTTSGTVHSETATTGATVALPALPTGASYGTVSVTTNNRGLIDGTPTVSGTTLTYNTTSQSNGATATVTIAVTGAANYTDYTVTVTVTAQDKQDAGVTVTLTNPPSGVTMSTGAGGYPTLNGFLYGHTVTLTASAAHTSGAGTWKWEIIGGGGGAAQVVQLTSNGNTATLKALQSGTAAVQVTYEDADYKDIVMIQAPPGRKLLNVAVTAADKTYDGKADVTLTPAITGAVNGDNPEVTLTGAPSDANAGKKTFDVTITLKDNWANKYDLVADGGSTSTITKSVTMIISKADPDVGTVSKSAPETIYPHTELTNITLTKTGSAAGTLTLDAGQTLTAGTKDYNWTFTPNDTANYNTKTGTVSLAVTADNVKSIAVTKNPTKTTYSYGDTLNTAGAEITATYDSGTTKVILLSDVTFSPTELKTVGTQTITATYQGKTDTFDVTVNQATWKNSAKAVTISNSDTSSQEVDLSAFLPTDGGTLSYAVAVTDTGTILDGTPAAASGKLTFTQKADVTGEKPATITVTVSSTNYADFTITVTVNSTGKKVPTVSANDLTKTYDGKTFADTDITGTATFEGTAVEGAWSFKASTKPQNVADSGPWVVVFTPDQVDVYATVEDTITVTINKAALTGTPTFTEITEAGKTLADVTLTKPSGWPEGSFTWALGDAAAVTQGTAYTWTFTPDSANYNTATGSVTPWAAPVVVNYTITLDPAGGSVSPTTVATAGGGKVPALPTPVRSGYTFTGWYNPQGNQIVAGNIIGADVTLTARWTYNGGGSSGGGWSSSDDDDSSSSSSTTKNPDGSTTQTQTKADGTTVETTTQKNGDKTVVETKKDGSSVTTVTNRDGFRATVKTSARGEVEASVTLRPSTSVVSLDIPAIRTTRENTITVNTGTSAVTRVEVPVSNVSAGTVAVLVKADGTTQVIKTSLPTAEGVIAPVKNGETISIVDNSKSFSDMRGAGWAQDAVDFVSARGIFNGTSSSTFSPSSELTRAQLMVVLASYDGADISGGSNWYEKGVEWAKNSGVSDGSNPNAVITREQLVTMLWNYAGRPAVRNTNTLTRFNDAGSVSDYAYQALTWAVENNLVSGVGSGVVSPQGTATRAQVAVIMRAFVEAQAK